MVVSEEIRNTADILIVDDVSINLRMLMQICEKGGYKVHGAASGEEAIAMANYLHPDLILMDIMLPDIDGLEASAIIRENNALRDVPIIFISARSDIDTKIKAFGIGGVDYVTKPIRMQEILARIDSHLRIRSLNKQLQDELKEKESLISQNTEINEQLNQEVEERKQTERRLESTLTLLKDTLLRTRAMNQIARSLLGEETVDDILQVIAENLVAALPAERVIVVTLNHDGSGIDRFVVEGSGASYETQPTFNQYMASLHGWVIEKVQPVISPKGRPDPRECVEEQKLRLERQRGSVIVVPLYFQGTMLGTIMAVNKPKEWDFTQVHLDLMAAVASQAAVTISNLRLSAETAYLKQFNEGIVQKVADAILVTNTELQITFANPAALSMLGYTEEEIRGQDLDVILQDSSWLYSEENKASIVKNGCQGVETQLSLKTGGGITVLLSAQPLIDRDEMTGLLVTFTDITAIKASAQALEQYAADLEARNAELDAFAHTVAHDLKNPLTSMMGFSLLLKERFHDLPERILDQHLEFIHRSAQTMDNIISELLLLASVREQDEIPMVCLQMDKIIDSVMQRLAYMIVEHNAVIKLPDSWPSAIGYNPWIEEVWMNYLSNGIKYSGNPSKGVPPTLILGADVIETSSVDGETNIRFWIRDNGPGLSEDEVKQLFTPFERLHHVDTEGHGLGLSIVQRIVQKLNGNVGVESQPGEGSTFSFTLPAYVERQLIIY